MPQSLAWLHVHLIFSTKHREPWLRVGVRDPLHRYVAVVGRNLKCPCVLAGSVEDHVHILFELARTVAVSEASSKWIKTQDGELGGFACQTG